MKQTQRYLKSYNYYKYLIRYQPPLASLDHSYFPFTGTSQDAINQQCLEFGRARELLTEIEVRKLTDE